MSKWVPLLLSSEMARARRWPGSARCPKEGWRGPGQLLSEPEQMAVNGGAGDGGLSSFWKPE